MRITPRLGPAILAASTVLLTLTVSAPPACAQLDPPPDEVYAVVELSEFSAMIDELQSREIHSGATPTHQRFGVRTEPPVDAFLIPPDQQGAWFITLGEFTLALRAAEPVDLGVEFVLRPGVHGSLSDSGEPLRIEIPASAFSAEQHDAWWRASIRRDEQLLADNVPGGAFFRWRAAQTREQLGLAKATEEPAGTDTARRSSVLDSYELFSGARAISENLALDRLLPLSAPGEELVPLDEIEGVTVRPYDWDELVAGLEPVPDPLAALIPEDQYAAFFPDFASLLELGDHAEAFGTPVIQLAEPRAVRSGLRAQLEAQLALPASTLARLLGPSVIRSVAVTGAGFELRSGSDLAVIFEAAEPKLLLALVTARVRTEAGQLPGAVRRDGELNSVAYEHYATPDRRLCSYVARLAEAVVVTNSLAQLQRLVDTHQGRRASLGSLQEYTFFRDRYPRDAADESAFVLLSDATIRRWCGPRWRIGASRLVRARAALRDVEMRHLTELATGTLSQELAAPDLREDLGALRVTAGTLHSPVWGSSHFSTPVLELDFDAVTEEEAVLYERWRTGYESNWRANFDPIAARLKLDAEELELDLSVRPLTTDSDYREYIETVGDGSLRAWGADPHAESLWHFTTALGESARRRFQQSPAGMFSAMTPALNPFEWLGSSVSFFADADPFFDELAAAEDLAEFMEANWHRLPLALHAEVESGLSLAAFLTGVRASIEGAAPGMTAWETREHAGEPYVRIGPSERALDDFPISDDEKPDAMEQVAVYYVATSQGLTVSLNEAVVKRAIERQLRRRETERVTDASKIDARVASAGGEPDWLGTHLGLKLDLAAIAPLIELGVRWNSTTPTRRASWNNLPILDEWRALFPDEDPVALHERLWSERLSCPGGGEYRWNAADGVMESSVYGHPGRPRAGPAIPPLVHTLGRADFGLTFEEDGLRARARLELKR